MIRVSHVLMCLACFPALVACSSYTPGFSDDSPQLVATPDDVSVMLADAADRASTALETLAAVEYSKAPGVAVAPVAGNAPVELQRAITINWVGPVEPITKTLADRASYKFMTIGSPPPVPLVVSIDVENRPVIDVLRDIGLQLGMRGDVRVDGQRKVVEIHYSPNTGVGMPAADVPDVTSQMAPATGVDSGPAMHNDHQGFAPDAAASAEAPESGVASSEGRLGVLPIEPAMKTLEMKAVEQPAGSS